MDYFQQGLSESKTTEDRRAGDRKGRGGSLQLCGCSITSMQLKCARYRTSWAHAIEEPKEKERKQAGANIELNRQLLPLLVRGESLHRGIGRCLFLETPFLCHHPFAANFTSSLDNPENLPAWVVLLTTIEILPCGSKHRDCKIMSQSSSRPTTC